MIKPSHSARATGEVSKPPTDAGEPIASAWCKTVRCSTPSRPGRAGNLPEDVTVSLTTPYPAQLEFRADRQKRLRDYLVEVCRRNPRMPTYVGPLTDQYPPFSLAAA
jgi:hypothetical protein